jgi:hypothetical protein
MKKLRENDAKRNQVKLLWFQAEMALNVITAVPHCGCLYG